MMSAEELLICWQNGNLKDTARELARMSPLQAAGKIAWIADTFQEDFVADFMGWVLKAAREDEAQCVSVPCSEGCRGYAVVHVARAPTQEIERCVACAKFDNDDDAAVAFVRDLERGVFDSMAMAERLLGIAHDDGEDA